MKNGKDTVHTVISILLCIVMITVVGTLLFHHINNPVPNNNIHALLNRMLLFGAAFCVSTVLYRLYQKRVRDSLCPVVRLKHIIIFAILFLCIFSSETLRLLEFEPAVRLNNWESANMVVWSNHLLRTNNFVGSVYYKYNNGLSLFYTPVAHFFGHSLFAAKSVPIVFFCICFILFYLISQKAFPSVNPFYTFILIALFNFPTEAFLKYKWHVVSVLAATGVFVAGYAFSRKNPWFYHLVSGCILFVSYVLYRGTIIYVPLVVFLIAIDCILQKRYRYLLNYVAFLCVLSGLILITGLHDSYSCFKFRVDHQSSYFDFSTKYILQIAPGYFRVLFPPNESIFYSFFLVLGMVYSFANCLNKLVLPIYPGKLRVYFQRTFSDELRPEQPG